jgi:hypothetical protein
MNFRTGCAHLNGPWVPVSGGFPQSVRCFSGLALYTEAAAVIWFLSLLVCWNRTFFLHYPLTQLNFNINTIYFILSALPSHVWRSTTVIMVAHILINNWYAMIDLTKWW